MRKILGFLAALLFAAPAWATCSAVPFVFSPGTTALSGQVNADLAALVACINALNGNQITSGTIQNARLDLTTLLTALSGLPHKANNAALTATASTAYTTVVRDGFAAPGDGGAATYTSSNVACPLNAGAGDNGSQVAASGGGCWLASFGGVSPTPQVWGAVGNGIADDTSALRAAAATGLPLYLPAGTYKVTDMITWSTGQVIRGEGRTESIISVPATFNLAALGVVRMGTAEPGATMLDIGISFTQPDAALKASMTAYPPAIYAVAVPRFILDRVRISGAWDGIKATGNTGGAYIGFLEVGAINKGIEMDGAVDFVHGGHWHIWPFGFTTANQLLAWAAAGVTGMQFGLVESLEIGAVTTFQAKLNFTAAATTTTQQIGRISLDGDGSTLNVVGQTLAVGSAYTTKDGASTTSSITVGAGGNLEIGYFDQVVAHEIDDVVLANASARLVINSGQSLSTSLDFSAFHVGAGVMSLNNIFLRQPAAGARTVGLVRQSGTGLLRMIGNSAAARLAATGPLVKMDTDSPNHFIVNNDFQDWTVTFPATILSGEYGPNHVAPFTTTPTVTFSTVGDFVPTYTSRGFNYQFLGAGVVAFDGFVQFNTNAYATAVGTFLIGTGGVPAAPISDLAITLSDLANVTFGAILSGAIIGTDTFIVVRNIASNTALGNFGTGNVLPSKTGVLFRFSGTYRYR